MINASLKYLNDKQKKENARYKRAQEDLKLVEKLWDELDEDEQIERRHSEDNPSIYKEKNCYLRSHVFHNGTIEATLREMGKHPEDKGFCLVKDELSSYFNSQNQYQPDQAIV